MPKPKKPLTPSQKYAKEAAASMRGSKKHGNMPKADLVRAIKRHKEMRDRLKSKE